MSTPTQDTPNVIAMPPVITLLHLAAGLAAHWLKPISILPPLPARILGVVLLLIAGTLALWARQTLLKAGTNVLPNKPTLAITDAGPFAHMRNPMYFSLCLVLSGVSLLFNGLLALLAVFPLFAILHFGVVLREETYLAAKFGEPYLAYQRRVRRWV